MYTIDVIPIYIHALMKQLFKKNIIIKILNGFIYEVYRSFKSRQKSFSRNLQRAKKTDLLYMSNKKENNVSVHTNFVLKQCSYGVMN